VGRFRPAARSDARPGVSIDTNRDAYICNVVKCRATGEPQADARPRWARLPALAALSSGAGEAPSYPAGRRHGGGRGAGIRGADHKLRWPVADWQAPVPADLSSLLSAAAIRHGSSDRRSWHTWQDLQEVRRRLDGLPLAPATTRPVAP